MKRIDRLILKELISPWFFGVASFTVLIMAGTYLFRITGYLMKGVPLPIICEFTLLLLPSILVKTFAMAALLSTLLAFGRLSSDSEIVALKACGTSTSRMILPAMLLGVVVSALGFAFNELVVPPASLRADALKIDIAIKHSKKSIHPRIYPIYQHGKLAATVSAKNYLFSEELLLGATVIAFDKQGKPNTIFLADKLSFQDENHWKLLGEGSLISTDGQTYIQIKEGAWPEEIPKLSFTPKDLIAKKLSESDALSMNQIQEQIRRAKKDLTTKTSQIRNLEYGYWSKITMPLAALIFSLVGAALGIRHQRTNNASGFWPSIVISFGYLLLTNVAAIYAQGGAVSPLMASLIPIVLGITASGIIIYRKSI